MAIPIYRLEQQITVEGKLHKIRTWLDVVVGGGASGYNTVPNGSHSPQDVFDVAEWIFGLIAGKYDPAHASFGEEILQKNVAGAQDE